MPSSCHTNGLVWSIPTHTFASFPCCKRLGQWPSIDGNFNGEMIINHWVLKYIHDSISTLQKDWGRRKMRLNIFLLICSHSSAAVTHPPMQSKSRMHPRPMRFACAKATWEINNIFLVIKKPCGIPFFCICKDPIFWSYKKTLRICRICRICRSCHSFWVLIGLSAPASCIF